MCALASFCYTRVQTIASPFNKAFSHLVVQAENSDKLRYSCPLSSTSGLPSQLERIFTCGLCIMPQGHKYLCFPTMLRVFALLSYAFRASTDYIFLQLRLEQNSFDSLESTGRNPIVVEPFLKGLGGGLGNLLYFYILVIKA